MKITFRAVALFLCASILFSLVACTVSPNDQSAVTTPSAIVTTAPAITTVPPIVTTPSAIITTAPAITTVPPIVTTAPITNTYPGVSAPSIGGNWETPGTEKPIDKNLWDADMTPNINITVIGGGQKEDSMTQAAAIDADITTMVMLSVQADLNSVGFTSAHGVAFDINNPSSNATGLYYYSGDFNLYEAGACACGFVEVVGNGASTTRLNLLDSTLDIVVEDIDIFSDLAEGTDSASVNKDYLLIYAYNYENIQTDHFVYKDKYVVYYQQSAANVKFDVYENKKENYDLRLGSLYDYDNNQYIYDESIFGEYNTHSALQLFGKENYEELEANLQKLSDMQLANGYIVSEFNIVYISPESIQAYLSSEEEDTFFGYNVAELTATFGLGTALAYTGDGFDTAQILTEDDSYNWKSFLIKSGIGCGIILVGAVLAPITVGASFGCALLTITEIALGTAITEGLGTLAIETVTGMIQGYSIEEALKNASHKGLDSFANAFMIGAAVGSIGVASGAIKPFACFVAGTSIAMAKNTYKDIEQICVGDYVLSYNEKDGTVSYQRVVGTFSNQVYQTVQLTINGERIETTINHPFYSPIYKCWIQAGVLVAGDCVMDSNGNVQTIQSTKTVNHSDPVTVYNFTVENTHTYFVGNASILVHNKCDNLLDKDLSDNEISNLRSKAGKQAKADALKDLEKINNSNQGLTPAKINKWAQKYGLDPTDAADKEIIDFVTKNNRFPSYAAGDSIQCDFAHGKNVSEIVDAYKSGKISANQAREFISNPQNGLLTSRENHLYLLHQGKWTNTTNYSQVVKLRPSVAEVVMTIISVIS